MLGITKWFDSAKGYGFINCAKGDIFVHYSDIEGEGYKSLNQGDEVDFSIVNSDKGLKAENVSIIKRAPVKENDQEKGNRN